MDHPVALSGFGGSGWKVDKFEGRESDAYKTRVAHLGTTNTESMRISSNTMTTAAGKNSSPRSCTHTTPSLPAFTQPRPCCLPPPTRPRSGRLFQRPDPRSMVSTESLSLALSLAPRQPGVVCHQARKRCRFLLVMGLADRSSESRQTIHYLHDLCCIFGRCSTTILNSPMRSNQMAMRPLLSVSWLNVFSRFRWCMDTFSVDEPSRAPSKSVRLTRDVGPQIRGQVQKRFQLFNALGGLILRVSPLPESLLPMFL